MVTISLFSATHFPTRPLFSHSTRPPSPLRLKPPPPSPRLPAGKPAYSPLTVTCASQDQRPQRTLFPGGYKRPEIKVPNLVLQLSPEDVLVGDGGEEQKKQAVLDAVDEAVSGRVGIVVLNFGEGGSGRKLYEAACLLKSVIRDRAYLLIAERVDIAAAVNASGVLVSDQGLPAIVARDTMMDSKSESVFLPLVARNVQSSEAAVNASSSEGADFLIYNDVERNPQDLARSVLGRVKIPIFVSLELLDEEKLFDEISFLLKSGASGLVVSLQGLRLVGSDVLNALYSMHVSNRRTGEKMESSNNLTNMDVDNGSPIQNGLAGFVKLEDRERKFIETERLLLLEALSLVQRAAPLMEEVSLLSDAISHLSEPFLLVIVGEFNSGKSTFINALLGKKYLQDGVVPTTNEITFLRYAEFGHNEQQRCERHPDGQYICYIPAPILKEMIIVDTPGTNVILQRQQRLTEEFVPRADLLLFVLSADRPLTESEVAFLRYTQQWKKRVVFVLNKADIYQDTAELEEAVAFVKDNTQKLLNTEVMLFPVSARSALKAKLSASSDIEERQEVHGKSSYWETTSFHELEKFLYSFLDGSTSTGIERMKLKLETPLVIAEQLLSASQKLVGESLEVAKQDLMSINELVGSVTEYAAKMESGSISWRRQSLSLIDKTQARVVELIESTLRLSNLDLLTSYVFSSDKSAQMPAAASVRNEIISPALLEAQKLLGEYVSWLQSNNAREVKFYEESFKKRRDSLVLPESHFQLEIRQTLEPKDALSTEVIEGFSAAAASKLFEQEIKEVFLGTFGGLGTAGLSASLLTSVLPTTLEDLLALGLCSAGGYIAIANFPVRRQKVVEKVKRTADGLARELEAAMQKDLLETTESLKSFVQVVGKPYQDLAQSRVDELLVMQDELLKMEERLKALQFDIQNLHRS